MKNSPWDRKFDRNYVDAMTAAALFLRRRKNCDIYYPASSNLGVNFCRYIHLPTQIQPPKRTKAVLNVHRSTYRAVSSYHMGFDCKDSLFEFPTPLILKGIIEYRNLLLIRV